MKTTEEIIKQFRVLFGKEVVNTGDDGNKYITKIITKEQESFLRSTITSIQREAYMKAYALFLKTIKEAKSKIPYSNDFHIVVDSREIEKALDSLQSPVKEEGEV